MAVLALDLGGTKLATAIFTNEGEKIYSNTVTLNKKSGGEVGQLITEEVVQCLRFAEEKSILVRSLGICVPGIAHAETGHVWAPNISGWENYPLRKELETVLAGKNIAAHIDSDRSCYILGERWKGNAQGCDNAIFLSVGTGIGAGILVNGKPLRGANDIGGAIGWMALDKPYDEKYISCGCFEYNASGEGIVKVAKEFIGMEKQQASALSTVADLSAKHIIEAYHQQDEIAVRVIDNAIGYWGMAAANLVSLFNPEKIIFGGGVFGPALQFLPEIYEESKKWAQPISINKVEFTGPALGADAGIYGAGYLALNNE
ncbi:MAG: ROK family protein [Chitinophagaceae bacterium]|nr:ROK family protein [Chitinophagaceae bacterium]MBK8953831.1 ROK family protein [Chitinophagaceae bacterium]